MTVAQARDLVGLTPSGLARKAGLHRQDIYDLESGKVQRPSWEVVGRIVAALRDSGMKGVTPEQLFPIDIERPAAAMESL